MSVKASKLFNGHEFSVPENALKPVLRRQAELTSIEDSNVPEGRVLNLRGWVLPEDAEAVRQAEPAYAANGETLPEIMPDSLADYVRMAASASLGKSKDDKRIPDLSAVATNVRGTRNGNVTPRFWYMLPDFSPRHRPTAFVARINHGLPWAECNLDPPLIIDANFSTFWPLQDGWTRFAIKALLNSIWCRAFMEALGTGLGGGALKLEATHLRQLAIPALSAKDKTDLDAAGKLLSKDAADLQAHIDRIILKAAFPQASSKTVLSELGRLIADKAGELSLGRRRVA